jgi:hypothetical protein
MVQGFTVRRTDWGAPRTVNVTMNPEPNLMNQ